MTTPPSLPFSRRGFLTLLAATGTVTSVEFLDRLLVRVAHANPQGFGDPYTIYVVKRWEVPLYVFDLSNADKPLPVAGATATVTSLYNDKVATMNTDANGVAVFDTRELSEPEEGLKKGELQHDFAFFGHVLIEKEGYRTFETGMMRFLGATELAAGTEPLNGLPYVQMATFDDWDIQYADKVIFTATSFNRDDHSFVIKTVVPDGKGVKATVYQEGGATFTADGSLDAEGCAVATLMGKFLSLNAEDAASALAVGTPVKIKVATAEGTGAGFEFETNMGIQKGAVDNLIAEKDKVFDLDGFVPNPAADEQSGNRFGVDGKITIPQNFPVIGGADIKLCIPGFPLTVEIDPSGQIIAGVKFTGSLHKVPKGGDLSSLWTRDTKAHSQLEAAKKADKYQSYYNNKKAAGAGDEKGSVYGRMPGALGFDPSLELGLFFVERWNDKDLIWQGSIQGYADVGLDVSYTMQFIIASFPVYVRFEFNIDAKLALEAGIEARANGKVYFSSGGGLSFQPTVEGAVGAGVGIAGALSLGVRGSGFISFMMNALVTPRSRPNPHMVVSGGVDVIVAGQMLAYKLSIPLFAMRWPYIWSNWPEEAKKILQSEEPSMHEEFFIRKPDGTLGYCTDAPMDVGALSQASFLDEAMILVTEDELAAAAELQATASNGAGGYVYSEARAESATTNAGYTLTPLQLGQNGMSLDETLMYKQVFSDPHIRVFSVDGTPYVARIVPVKLTGGQARTRLTVAKMDAGAWGAPTVVEFTYGAAATPARDDVFDYDFDVVSSDEGPGAGNRWADGSCMRFILVSGTRPSGDTSKVSEVASHCVSAFISLDENLAVKKQHVYFDDFNRTDRSSMLVYPNILSCKTPAGDWLTVAFALHRIAQPGKSVFEDGYEEYPSDCLYGTDGEHVQASSAGFVDVPRNLIKAPGGAAGALDILTDAKQDLAVSVYSVSNEQLFLTYHYLMAASDDETLAPQIKTVLIGRVIFFGEYHAALYLGSAARGLGVSTWKGLGKPGAVLCANGRNLTALWLGNTNGAVESPTDQSVAGDGDLLLNYPQGNNGMDEGIILSSGYNLQTADIALDSTISLDRFELSNDGTMLYYATVRDGKQQDTFDDEGNRTEGAMVQDYRIWGSRIVTDATGAYKFMEPFPLANTAHPSDSLACVGMPDAFGFVANSITKLETSTSDIYFYAVPKLIHLTLIGFVSVTRFVCAGQEETFRVTVRNDGNTAIDSFVLVLTGQDGSTARIPVSIPEVVPEPSLDDVEYTPDSGVYRPQSVGVSADEDIAAVFEEAPTVFDVPTEAGVIIPGKTKTYRFNWTVPENWQGETSLDVSIDLDSQTVSSQAKCRELSIMADSAKTAAQLGMTIENSVSYAPTDRTIQLVQEELPVDRTDYRYFEADGTPAAAGGENNKNSDTADTSPTAKTGDSLEETVMATLAVLVGGAAVAGGASAMASEKNQEPSE